MFKDIVRVAIILCLVSMASCGTNKNVTYFRDIPDSSLERLNLQQVTEFKSPLIQKNDILQISILTLDPTANSVLTESNSALFQTTNSNVMNSNVQGFLVDANGFIELPIVGRMKVEGLTTTQARDTIHKKVEIYYKSPVVNVRFANFSVTVLGEVLRPGTFTVANEKVSALDAIGLAGDLTIYGKRQNVLLIREIDGRKSFARLDLTSSKLLASPNFYLRQGDILYVEPNESKLKTVDAAVQSRNYALIASVLTVLVVILSRF